MNEQMCKIIRIFCDIANRPHLHTNIFCGGLENKTIQEKKKNFGKGLINIWKVKLLATFGMAPERQALYIQDLQVIHTHVKCNSLTGVNMT